MMREKGEIEREVTRHGLGSVWLRDVIETTRSLDPADVLSDIQVLLEIAEERFTAHLIDLKPPFEQEK